MELPMRHTRKAQLFWPLVVALLVADCTTKQLAVEHLRSTKGVIDFIDVGVGSWRFWTFNLADACITLGAVALVAALWQGGRDEGA